MEALACRDGVLLAKEKEVNKLHIETDFQELAGLWERGDYHRSFLAPILAEICELSSGFHDFALVYASRFCNRIAHELAKQVTEDNREGEWQIPPGLYCRSVD